MAHVLAESSEASLRNGVEAVRFAERAVTLSGAKDAMYLDTLAAAYAETGRFEDAVATARRAMEIAASQNQARVREALAAKLLLYQARKPYREEKRAQGNSALVRYLVRPAPSRSRLCKLLKVRGTLLSRARKQAVFYAFFPHPARWQSGLF